VDISINILVNRMVRLDGKRGHTLEGEAKQFDGDPWNFFL
jgi:hypothetical protein